MPNIGKEVIDLEKREREMRAYIMRALRDLSRLVMDTKREEKFKALRNYKGELTEDVMMERDVVQVLRDFIYAFRDLILITRDLAAVERTEGPQARAIHKKFMGVIETELSTLMREIGAAKGTEARV
jgi:hypothetical protein